MLEEYAATMAEQGEDTPEPCSSARVCMFECLMTKYPNAEGVIPLSRQEQATLQSACSGLRYRCELL